LLDDERAVCSAAITARTSLTAAITFLTLAAPSPAKNPADPLRHQPMDPEIYQPATHCTHRPARGALMLQSWLTINRKLGVSFGIEECRHVHGSRTISLHAEGRALDWGLNAFSPSEGVEGRYLMRLFLARDRSGIPHALARRMGIEELIFNCRYWASGMNAPRRYGYCYDASGALKDHLDPAQAHQNHIHIGLNKLGARGKTSFWRRYPQPLTPPIRPSTPPAPL
jgi:hypothetical protein